MGLAESCDLSRGKFTLVFNAYSSINRQHKAYLKEATSSLKHSCRVCAGSLLELIWCFMLSRSPPFLQIVRNLSVTICPDKGYYCLYSFCNPFCYNLGESSDVLSPPSSISNLRFCKPACLAA